MHVVSAWRIVRSRSFAGKGMRSQFDLQQHPTMHFNKAGIAPFAGHGELETVPANQSRPAMTPTPKTQAVERNAFVQQLHIAPYAMLTYQAQCLIPQSQAPPDPGADAGSQHHQCYMPQIDHATGSTASTRMRSACG